MSHPVVIVIIVMGLTAQSFVAEFSYKCGSVLGAFCPSPTYRSSPAPGVIEMRGMTSEGITQQLGHTPNIQRYNNFEPP